MDNEQDITRLIFSDRSTEIELV